MSAQLLFQVKVVSLVNSGEFFQVAGFHTGNKQEFYNIPCGVYLPSPIIYHD